jgi:two-component system response regulator NreC
VLADDHKVMRHGLQLVLETEPDFEVVGQAGDVPSVRRLVLSHRPDVLVLDLNMPGGSVLAAIPKLREDAPETQIVVLTMQDDPSVAQAVLHAGARAFVLKEAADGELVMAIRRAAEGEPYVNRDLAGRMAAQRMRARSVD